MARAVKAFEEPLALAIAESATSPAGTLGDEIWSTVSNKRLRWNGTTWQASGELTTTTASVGEADAGKVVTLNAQGRLDDTLTQGFSHLNQRSVANFSYASAPACRLRNCNFGDVSVRWNFVTVHSDVVIWPRPLPRYAENAAFTDRPRWWLPIGGTTNTKSRGLSLQTYGSVSACTVEAGYSAGRRASRLRFVSAAAAGSFAGMKDTISQWRIGNASYASGGFFMHVRWSSQQSLTGARLFIGMAPAGVPANNEPSAWANVVGLGMDSTDAYLNFITTTGAAVARKTASTLARGSMWNASSPVWTECMIAAQYGNAQAMTGNWCSSSSSAFLDSGHYHSGTQCPDKGAALVPTVLVSNANTAQVVSIDIHHIYTTTAA